MTELNNSLSSVSRNTIFENYKNETSDDLDISINNGSPDISIDGSEKVYLHHAIEEGYNFEEIVNLIADINAKDTEGNTPLHLSILYGYFTLINLLLDKGADINIKDSKGNTPLHVLTQIACRPEESEATKALTLLIKKVDNIDCRDKCNSTLLHYAAKLGNLEVVKLFIENGADINAQNKSLNTPLHYAIDSGATNVIQYLTNKGANINLKNQYGNTSLNLFEKKRQKEESTLKGSSFLDLDTHLNNKDNNFVKVKTIACTGLAIICLTAYLTTWYITSALAVAYIIVGSKLLEQPEGKLDDVSINQTLVSCMEA